MRPDELDRRLRERLDVLPPAARAELLHVLMLPDFERADRIGEFARGRPERLGLYVAATANESLPQRWLLVSL